MPSASSTWRQRASVMHRKGKKRNWTAKQRPREMSKTAVTPAQAHCRDFPLFCNGAVKCQHAALCGQRREGAALD